MTVDLKEDIVSYNWTRNRASKQSFLYILQVQFFFFFLLGLTTSHKNHEIHFKTR